VDGRPPLDPEIRHWLGESRGHWEGDTLVVETTNFNGESPMLIVGPGAKPLPTSQQLRIVERLTRIDADTIDYEIAVEDPVMLTQPWKAAFPLERDDDYRFFEYACHEDNSAIRNFIETSRFERAQKTQAAAERP
jgi:predicted ATPase